MLYLIIHMDIVSINNLDRLVFTNPPPQLLPIATKGVENLG